jgi:hypothetical protein
VGVFGAGQFLFEPDQPETGMNTLFEDAPGAFFPFDDAGSGPPVVCGNRGG